MQEIYQLMRVMRIYKKIDGKFVHKRTIVICVGRSPKPCWLLNERKAGFCLDCWAEYRGIGDYVREARCSACGQADSVYSYEEIYPRILIENDPGDLHE